MSAVSMLESYGNQRLNVLDEGFGTVTDPFRSEAVEALCHRTDDVGAWVVGAGFRASPAHFTGLKSHRS